VLAELERRGVHWGIVTNKPAFLTDPLLAALKLDRRASCIVSGDTVAQRKPHPGSLLHAAQLIKCEPAHCLYVGDAERDVKAAHAAGMRVLIALFGYLADTDRPQDWQADGMINAPSEVLDWVTASARTSQPQAAPAP
jgi:N-acetyl-D-muramate 6-phosphate phosphatase